MRESEKQAILIIGYIYAPYFYKLYHLKAIRCTSKYKYIKTNDL